MGKKKLIRFKENETFNNLFQYSYSQLTNEGFHLKGKWNMDYFKNPNPVILELGCGKGEYTVKLAQQNPHKNFIGIDIKGARLWWGCKTAMKKKLLNVAFIRTRIHLLDHYFAENEVSEIWLTFPDPQPQQSRIRKRLTHPHYIELYKRMLKPDGIIHLKTDNNSFVNYTLGVIKEKKLQLHYHSNDIYSKCNDEFITGIQTFYEKMYLEKNKKINYLRFKTN